MKQAVFNTIWIQNARACSVKQRIQLSQKKQKKMLQLEILLVGFIYDKVIIYFKYLEQE